MRELLERIDSREISEWQAFYILQSEEYEAQKRKAETESKVRRRK